MSPYTISVVTLVCINVIVALGLYVTILSGQLSALHAALLGVGGYAAGYLAVNFETSLWLTLLVGAVAGGLVGVLVCCCLFRLAGFYLSIATLAVGQALVTVANNVSGLGGADGLSGVPLRVGLTLALVSAVVVFLGVLYWERSLGGFAARALGEDETAAQSVGISLRRVRVSAFLVGGALAGFAGAMQAQNVGIVVPSSLSFQAEVTLFFYVGIGGMASSLGAVSGAVIITVLPELLRFSTYDRYLYFGLALALMMVLRPFGLIPRIPLGRRIWPLSGTDHRRRPPPPPVPDGVPGPVPAATQAGPAGQGATGAIGDDQGRTE